MLSNDIGLASGYAFAAEKSSPNEKVPLPESQKFIENRSPEKRLEINKNKS